MQSVRLLLLFFLFFRLFRLQPLKVSARIDIECLFLYGALKKNISEISQKIQFYFPWGWVSFSLHYYGYLIEIFGILRVLVNVSNSTVRLLLNVGKNFEHFWQAVDHMESVIFNKFDTLMAS